MNILKIAVGFFISMIVIHGCFIILEGPFDIGSLIIIGIESIFLIVSWFVIKQKNWARYCLATIALLCLLFIFLAPLSAHAIERTTLFYFFLALSAANLSFLLYALFINKNVNTLFE